MSKNPKRASRRGRLAAFLTEIGTAEAAVTTAEEEDGHRRPARDGLAEQEPSTGKLFDTYAELDALYQELGPGLIRYLRRLLHSSVLAEDIAQDAFLILMRKWPDVRNHPCPKAWLYTVAKHLAIDTLKERSREFLSEEPDQATAGWIDLWDSHDARTAVREAVGKLPPRQREAVWLYYFCGFKQNEVATIMQIQRGTAAALLFQARGRLAGLLGA
jgi:RNA polymerase sigma-70 factor, ECF subfamily